VIPLKESSIARSRPLRNAITAASRRKDQRASCADKALVLSMILHELGTNAVKYGALSDLDGSVGVTWNILQQNSGRELHLEWREADGPPVSKPTRKGFGSTLIERALGADHGKLKLIMRRLASCAP
jgi:two-component sensor histidine kinase